MKWHAEENLRLYVFVMFNFKYIMVTKFGKQLDGLLEKDDNGAVIGINLKMLRSINQIYPDPPLPANPAPSEALLDADPSPNGATKAKKKGRKGKKRALFAREFYKKMYDYFNSPSNLSRKRDLLRCRTHKMFQVYKNTVSKETRWKNNQIVFRDMVEAYLDYPDKFHCSQWFNQVKEPLESDRKIITKQIALFFKVDLQVEDIEPLDNKVLNRVYWKDAMPEIYKEFKKYLRHMERQKEIFKRDFQGRTEEKIHQYQSFKKNMKEVLAKMQKSLRYLAAENLLLKGKSSMKAMLDSASARRSEELKEKRLKLESTTALKGSTSAKKPKRILRKRKPISKFHATSDKSIKEEYMDSLVPIKRKKVKTTHQGFEDYGYNEVDNIISLDDSQMSIKEDLEDGGFLDFFNKGAQVKIEPPHFSNKDYNIFKLGENGFEQSEQHATPFYCDDYPYMENSRFEDL